MTTELKEKVWEVELTSDCVCYDCTTCGVGYVGAEYEQKCDECEATLTHADSCFGCWDDSESNFYEALAEWRKEVGVDWNLVRIEGTGMGWQGRNGYAVAKFDEALKSLTLNGDFRINAKWEGNSFTARRASHDEPTGNARFVFTLINEEDE
jgi:hypothetical protein